MTRDRPTLVTTCTRCSSPRHFNAVSTKGHIAAMPPRLQLLSRATKITSRPSIEPFAPFLYPFLVQQRSASILSSLSDLPGAYNKKIRRGRGPASGKGKTSGRGHKGQKQHGKVPVGFNGGQTPDEVVAGKRGFTNVFSVDMSSVNLNKIQLWIDKGRLDPSKPITLRELSSTRCVHGVKPDGIKLLARGAEELKSPIHIVVSRASAEAISAVEKLGGTVTTRYYSPFAVRQIVNNQMHPVLSLLSDPKSTPAAASTGFENPLNYRYRLPDPSSRKHLEYYRDAAHRGYLSHLVEDGQTASLFFKTPTPTSLKGITKKPTRQSSKTAKSSENRVW